MELERNAAALRQQGLGLAAISYDSVAVLRNFAQRKGIHFSLLSDPDSKMIRAFGILNESVPANNAAFYGIPYPGTFIVDHDGKVTAKFFEDDFRQRYSASEILVRQFGASPEASRSQITYGLAGYYSG